MFSILFVYILNFTIFEADPIVLDGLPLVIFLFPATRNVEWPVNQMS